MGKTNSKLVLAIEIGNVFSGYAYSAGIDSPDKIYTATHFNDLQMDRVPTALLLNDDNSLVSFGFDAQQKYMTLSLKNEHLKYRFINSIKVHRGTDNKFYINDFRGEKILAEDIFIKIVNHLRELCLEQIKKHEFFKQTKKCLVVVVPSDISEELRNAMKKDGEKEVIFVSATQAGSVYCARQNFILDNSTRKENYIVVNFGKEATTVCLEKPTKHNNFLILQEKKVLSGGDSILNTLFEYIREQYKMQSSWDDYKRGHAYDYMTLRRAIENEIHRFNNDTESVVIKVPNSLLVLLDQNPHCSDVFREKEDDKIYISKESMHGYFRKTLNGVISAIQNICSDQEGRSAIVLLLGGYSNSPIIREAIKEGAGIKSVLLVPEPNLAVLKGAIMLQFLDYKFADRLYGFISLSRPNDSLSSYTIGHESQEEYFIKVIDWNDNLRDNSSFKCHLNLTGNENEKPIVLYKTKSSLQKDDCENGRFTRDDLEKVTEKDLVNDKWNEVEEIEVRVSVKGNNVEFSIAVLDKAGL